MRRTGGWVPAVVLALAFVLGLAGATRAADELDFPKFMSLYNQEGRLICQTGFRLDPGDEYVDAENFVWRVVRVEGETTAVAESVGRLDLSSAVQDFQASLAGTPLAQPGERRRIGIYHTHSDESYAPSDGTASDPNGTGGVYRVGESLGQALREAGYVVSHSQVSHVPHDAGAYDRSRRTAMELVQGAAAVFDVHRDAAPAEAYAREIGGRTVTQIMLVVGRENPQAEANLGFAQALKAAADRVYPGLVRGILRTGGRFNQDLSSRALLLEVGAHMNRREEAEAAVRDLAKVIPTVLGGVAPSQGVGAWRAAGIIAAVVVIGGGLWLYIATGGDWRAAWDKLRTLGQEFAGYLGRRPRR